MLQTHLPGYVSKAEDFRQKGISEIVCIAVNDPFVMAAWGKEHGTKDKVDINILSQIKVFLIKT